MDLGLFRLRGSAREPAYATPGVVAVPAGSCLIVSLRSSTPMRYGVIQPHGIGVIDQDYNGPEDELRIPLLNLRRETVAIPAGTRIAQGLLLPIEQATFAA